METSESFVKNIQAHQFGCKKKTKVKSIFSYFSYTINKEEITIKKKSAAIISVQ